ncbi:hypothetical protein PFISCL1PPCAC_20788, partial [Pristionchus fissidentatus]
TCCIGVSDPLLHVTRSCCTVTARAVRMKRRTPNWISASAIRSSSHISAARPITAPSTLSHSIRSILSSFQPVMCTLCIHPIAPVVVPTHSRSITGADRPSLLFSSSTPFTVQAATADRTPVMPID